MAILLMQLPNDCLTSIAELVPTRYWPQLRSTCRDLRAAVRDATTGLVIDLTSLPFDFLTPTASSSPLPTDRLLLSRVREVRILLHKHRDTHILTTDRIGEAGTCPVAPLLREIDRARSAAAAAAANTAAAAPLLLPLRVSLCVRAPRGVIELPAVTTWLVDSGIAARVNTTVDLRAEGADFDKTAAVLGRGLPPPSLLAWRGFPPECRFRVEMKFAGITLHTESSLLLTSLAEARVASLSVLSFPRPPQRGLGTDVAGERPAAERRLGLVRMFSETLEELLLADTVPARAVDVALTGGGGEDEPRCRWPALRKLVLRGSPDDSEGGDGDLSPFFFSPRADGGEADEEEPPVLFPSLETLAVKGEHAGAWLRHLGDAIDPVRVALERL